MKSNDYPAYEAACCKSAFSTGHHWRNQVAFRFL